MHRVIDVPRVDWQKKVESQGLSYHTHTANGISVPYWFEGAHYELSLQEIDHIEEVSNELHGLCLRAAERIIEQGWITTRLALPGSAVPVILASWENDDKSLYGRFDFSYNPELGPEPKLLEYNADTPTGLIEAGVIQWYWLEERYSSELKANGVDQFNSIHESLIEAWRQMSAVDKVHFTGILDVPEDYQTLLYLADTAAQAGKRIELLDISRIGWKTEKREFWGENDVLRTVFKLYPWENLFREEFGAFLESALTSWIEPAWKILIGNKALLPILWEMYPDHPNLLPSYDQPAPLGDTFCRKALYSREGANMVIRRQGAEIVTGGSYATGPFIYQMYYPSPDFSGKRPVIGSWMINHEAHGIGIRESNTEITDNLSQFVPHLIRD